MKVNWKIRFHRENIAFVVRFVIAVLTPLVAYLGIEFKDITSWDIFKDILLQALLNPYVLSLMAFNGWNMTGDPTSKGLRDSERALNYDKPAR